MHLNPIHPNILHDMQAAANGRDLRNRDRFGVVSAKRHMAKGLEDMFGPKRVPYASERQNTRTNRKMVRLANKIDWDKERTIDLIERERERQSLAWDIDGH